MPRLIGVIPILAAGLGCGGGGGGGLAGRWSGELDISDVGLPISISLHAEGQAYSGTGTLDCTDYVGEPCLQDFSLTVTEADADEAESGAETILDVNISDCTITQSGATEPTTCTDPDEAIYDGDRSIRGQWSGGDFSLERG